MWDREYREVQELVESNKASIRPIPRGTGLLSVLYSTPHINVQTDYTMHSELKMQKH